MTIPTKEALTPGERIARQIDANLADLNGYEQKIAAEIDAAIAKETARLREALHAVKILSSVSMGSSLDRLERILEITSEALSESSHDQT